MSKVEIKQELGTLFLMTLSGATLHGDYNGLTLGDEKELYPDFGPCSTDHESVKI